jgi:hypothetical protein
MTDMEKILTTLTLLKDTTSVMCTTEKNFDKTSQSFVFYRHYS